MTRKVTLPLDEFGQRALDRLVAHDEAALRTAALYYLSDRDAGRPAWRAPRFRSSPSSSPGLRVAYDGEAWAALEEEARRQGVVPEALAVHALLYFVADLDSGRVAARFHASLGKDE